MSSIREENEREAFIKECMIRRAAEFNPATHDSETSIRRYKHRAEISLQCANIFWNVFAENRNLPR
jgi:hypothetical protein